MDFAEWLQGELDRRGWDQAELARRSGITTAQVSRVISGGRNAGADFCIAIANALNLSREEVFRARGWLLSEPEKVVPPGTDPLVTQVAEELISLPVELRELSVRAILAVLKAVRGGQHYPAMYRDEDESIK
ncbi:MAG: helix-turn-helix transcriptional regulator [Ardenticatenales bacterium]|nr:helix-turn-helix transcriptional regulator [Ardenticatenales bacterium]